MIDVELVVLHNDIWNYLTVLNRIISVKLKPLDCKQIKLLT